MPDESSAHEIIGVRHKADGDRDVSTISEEEISDLVSMSREVLLKISDLIPESTKT